MSSTGRFLKTLLATISNSLLGNSDKRKVPIIQKLSHSMIARKLPGLLLA